MSLSFFKSVKALELVARKNATSVLTGNYVTTFTGRGFHFHEARKYIAGEPDKSIDWNMTARMNEPYVKVVNDERQREVIIVLDTSPSMRTGWQGLTKLDYAIEISATLALSAIEAGDRFGFLLFSDKVHSYARASTGKRQLHHALRAFLQAKNSTYRSKLSDPRLAIKQLQQQKGRKFIIFLVSDFIDEDVPDDIKYLQKRHDVNLVHIFDRLEFSETGDVFFSGYSPEAAYGPIRFRPDLSREHFLSDLKDRAQKLKINLFSYSTITPATIALRELFYYKRLSINKRI